jgi:hypothetical protein
MTNSFAEPSLSPSALAELQTLVARVRIFASAQRMWDRLFTSIERDKLGGDLAAAWRRLGTLGMWMEAYGVSADEAILDVAVGIGHLSPSNYAWLRREMGLPPGSRAAINPLQDSAARQQPDAARCAGRADAASTIQAPAERAAAVRAAAPPVVPSWNKSIGELRFRGVVIRKVRIMARPSNIQIILNSFEEQGWPERIDNPLPGGVDQDRLNSALQSLRQGLRDIRFQMREGARAITWSAP